MNLSFTEVEMQEFLRKRFYHNAKAPCHYLLGKGPEEEDKETTCLVAIKEDDFDELKKLYWQYDIEIRFGLKAVFEKELKRTLLRL